MSVVTPPGAPVGASTGTLARIRAQMPAFSASEKAVARWMVEHHDQVPHLSMGRVAQESGVSDTTVLRFCRTLGLQGFTELKFHLIQELAATVGSEQATDATAGHEVARMVFAQATQALADTLAVMDGDAFQRAVVMLAEANRILIIGVGTSSPVVESMHQRLFRLGLNCRAQTDAYLQLMDAALVAPGDVVVGISHTGASLDPIATLRTARQAGAATICITGNAESPITEYADVTLVSVSQEIRVEALSSRIAQVAIVDSLYVALSMHDRARALSNEQRAYDAVLPKTV